MTNDKLLRIYLNDHLAGSVAGYELAKRCAANNEGTALADFVTHLAANIEQEQGILVEAITRLGGKPDRLKQGAAWVAEKAGRLKLNGRLTGYSDLSRVLELEGLALGIAGKLSLWHNLKTIAEGDDRLATLDIDWMIKRGEEQKAEVERHKLEAAARAFRGSTYSA